MDRGDCGLGTRPHRRCDGGEARSRLRAGAAASPQAAGVSRMLMLHEYRRKADRLADHLPWAALVAPGVVLNKDGSFSRVLAFRGPDLESATEAELISVAARSEEHTSELQSLMRISSAVFCLK